MPGQVIPRGKAKWLVRVYLGRDPQTGKRQYHNRTIHGGKKLATEYLTAALRERDTGTLRAGQEQTIGSLLDDLLLDHKINGKDFGWASLLVERHLRPTFGAMPISRIPQCRGGGLSPSQGNIFRYILPPGDLFCLMTCHYNIQAAIAIDI